MMNFIILIFLFTLNSWAQGVERSFCENELNKAMKSLISEDDGEFLSNSFNIASLKLASKVVHNGGEGKSLEKNVRSLMKKINSEDKRKLKSKLQNIYNKFGRSADSSKLSKIIEDLDEHNYFPKSERLSNESISVVMMAYELLDPCKVQSFCINDNDTAIMWFMDKLHKNAKNKISNDNLLHASVKVAHNVGLFSNVDALSGDEILNKIKSYSRKNRVKVSRKIDEFNTNFNECTTLLGGQSCVALKAEKLMQSNLNNILNELQDNQVKSLSDPLKVKLTDGLVLNLKGSLQYKKKPVKNEPLTTNRIPTSIVTPIKRIDGDKPFMCGGKSFESETKIKDLWSFDPLRLWSNIKHAKNPSSAADKMASSKDSNPKGKNRGLFSFIEKLCPKGVPIGGPFFFKCSPYMKWIVLRKKLAESKICCEDKVQWKEFNSVFAGTTGGVEGKVFVGIPSVAEFGGLLGLAASINVGGGKVPENCIEKNCIQGSALISAYGGLYLDVGFSKLKNAIGGEAKISWKPYASLMQCLYPTGKLPPAEFTLSLGAIYAQGTIYAGWVFTYDFYKKIWESTTQSSHSIAIF